MVIPESQLATWSSQGSITQSAQTYGSVKLALESKDTSYASKDYETFLQGSYGNDTNVYADSDVDVVIKINALFFRDLSRLTPEQAAAYIGSFENANYSYTDFKQAVVAVLSKRFPNDVSLGKKALWIKPNAGRRNADVIISAQFRRYHEFHNLSDQRYDEGLAFLTANGTLIENFPKQHSANLTKKHQDTNKRLKPIVRVFKNMRNHIREKKLLADDVAPSYFIEGMLYNVPDDKFTASYADTVAKCHDWLAQSDQTKLVCANHMHWLVRAGETTSWAPEDFAKFLSTVRDIWMKW
jgi:hypothetical protein